MSGKTLAIAALTALVGMSVARAEKPVEMGNNRELFVDHRLIDKLENARMVLARPVDQGAVVAFDKPWEGLFCGYCTVIKDGDTYRLYYRGRPDAGRDGTEGEVTCYAESKDGIAWTKPEIGLFDSQGSKKNNIILANAAPLTHNFSPFLDTRPDVSADQRYKALAGTMESGLVPFVSTDGIRWTNLQSEPVIPRAILGKEYGFDSQNVSFWSPAEKKYLCYYRIFKDKIRRIVRTSSDDFVHWSEPTLMEYSHLGGTAPIEQLYTSQTHPYFRAPHIYVAIAARFMPGRQVLTDAEAAAIKVHPSYFKDCSDGVFMTTRGDGVYDRTFLEGFIRPGIGPRNWVSRTNYPALNVVQTGPDEMSVYVNQDYGQPTAHLRRYSLRLDGFASVQAPYEGGTLTTKPLTFAGKKLLLNFATSGAGGARVEVLDGEGKTIPGFAVTDARELIGNEIEKAVSWKGGEDVSKLAGKPVRLRFHLKDADVYAMRFAE